MVENEIPVRVFSNKMTKKGTMNPSYKNMLDVLQGEGYTSLAAAGNDSEATRVRITRGHLAENTFPSRQNPEDIIVTSSIAASFISPIRKDECKDDASFYGNIVVGSIVEENDKEGLPTGRLIINGLIPQWGGRLEMIKYIVANENAVNHIKNYWNQGDTVKIKGKINFSVKTEYIEEEMGFGEPIRSPKTTPVHELVITSGSAGGMDEEQSYDVESVQRGLTERKARIEALKERNKVKAEEKSSQTDSWGF